MPMVRDMRLSLQVQTKNDGSLQLGKTPDSVYMFMSQTCRRHAAKGRVQTACLEQVHVVEVNHSRKFSRGTKICTLLRKDSFMNTIWYV